MGLCEMDDAVGTPFGTCECAERLLSFMVCSPLLRLSISLTCAKSQQGFLKLAVMCAEFERP